MNNHEQALSETERVLAMNLARQKMMADMQAMFDKARRDIPS